MEEKIETVRKMLKRGMSIVDINSYTDLSIEQIKKLMING
jgi:hypothetical protein